MVHDLRYMAWRLAGRNASDAIYSPDTVLAYHAVYACITLIANDIRSFGRNFVEQDSTTRVWREIWTTTWSAVASAGQLPDHYSVQVVDHLQAGQQQCLRAETRGTGATP